MAKTSPSSGAAEKEAVIDVAMPYGTRSRNRTAGSRPNYAEDKDIEMDMYDHYPDKKDSDAGKKSSRQVNGASNGDAPRTNGSSRKNASAAASAAAAAADDSKTTGSSQNGAQDAKSGGTIHASQATSGAGTSQASRKRKAAASQNGGGTAAASTATSAAATPPATSLAAKKNALAAQNQLQGLTWAESNMLTFETCKGMPDNGRMVADDGTVLEANGR